MSANKKGLLSRFFSQCTKDTPCSIFMTNPLMGMVATASQLLYHMPKRYVKEGRFLDPQ